jgi:diguanylate cyclase (GGDEF)-like protein
MARTLGGEDSANGRSLACVWGFGSTCLTATILLPHPPAASDPGLIGVAVIGYLVAAVLFARAARIPEAAFEAVTYLGQLLITALTFFWGAPAAPFLWFHVWLVVHSFHFLPRTRAMRQIACAAVLFVFATFAMHAPFPEATSVVGVGSIVIIGMLVGAFRARVDALVAAFARTAASDPLTGLANRRAFAELYAGERARAARAGTGGAMLVLDCDRFKELNDRLGHAAGDRALQRVAHAMTSTVRAADTVARLGGDEFAVLLSAPEPGMAVAVGERIRRVVAEGRDSDNVTLSIGIVELPADTSIDLNTAFAAADRAMYESKNRGANCVSLGSLAPLPEHPQPAEPARATDARRFSPDLGGLTSVSLLASNESLKVWPLTADTDLPGR